MTNESQQLLCYPDDNERIISSLQHTLDHLDCPACGAIRDATLSNDPDSLLHLKFPAAAEKWLTTMEPYLNVRTCKMYRHHISSLDKFFGGLILARIHIGHIRQYQTARQMNEMFMPDGTRRPLWKRRCGSSIINHEISIVQQVLKRAGNWKKIAPHYKPLPTPAFTPKKTMTDEEEDRLFAVGESDPEFALPLMVAYLSVNTTACGSELRNIRLEDITLAAMPPRLLIAAKTAKNGYRGRVIPLNETAEASIRKCLERANALGSILPHQYLFPKRITTGYWNPDKPTSPAWLSKRWKALREAAGLPWLTPHCLRHMAITRMLEFGVPEETVRNIAGHVSAEMMRHYSHGRVAASAKALDVIDPRHRKQVRPEIAKRIRMHA